LPIASRFEIGRILRKNDYVSKGRQN
jgi:hypothetical protein